MAKKSLIVSCNNKKVKYIRSMQAGKKPKFGTKVYNRCELCGRPHGYMGLFKMCRICFRELAVKGLIPGVTRSSW